jgi:hypothetical protein
MKREENEVKTAKQARLLLKHSTHTQELLSIYQTKRISMVQTLTSSELGHEEHAEATKIKEKAQSKVQAKVKQANAKRQKENIKENLINRQVQRKINMTQVPKPGPTKKPKLTIEEHVDEVSNTPEKVQLSSTHKPHKETPDSDATIPVTVPAAKEILQQSELAKQASARSGEVAKGPTDTYGCRHLGIEQMNLYPMNKKIYNHYIREGEYLHGLQCQGCRRPSEDIDTSKKGTLLVYCDIGCGKTDWCDCFFCYKCSTEQLTALEKERSNAGNGRLSRRHIRMG